MPACMAFTILFLYENLENSQSEASVTVDNLSASWTYDAANTILSGVTFKVTKVTTYDNGPFESI